MKDALIVLLIAVAPGFIEGVIEWAAKSYLISWIALFIAVAIIVSVLLGAKLSNDEPDNYYQVKDRNSR